MDQETILKDLNPPQKEAVVTWQGPLLILAGAGSGKTRALTHRIAYLIAVQNIAPRQILAVTFTNRAAKEMRARVETLLDDHAKGIMLGTFHSCCLRILRRECHHIGFNNDFVIYDTDDQSRILKSVLQDLKINDRIVTPRIAQSRISRAKNKLIIPEKYLQSIKEPSFLDEQIVKVYKKYQEGLRANGAMDFDDLIVNAIELFDQFPEVAEHYQDRFRYVLVDEYQDTNHMQYKLIRQLTKKYQNICCVGDDDQSIYGWRGADIKNILNFESDYPEAKIIRLEQNYRSTSNILKAASAVVRVNRMRKVKELWTKNQDGSTISAFEAQTEREEADEIVSQIKKIMQFHPEVKLNDFAILYRTNAQSRSLENGFQLSRIPYTVVGGLRFYERKEIKDALAYLRLVTNTVEEMSLRRIINVPRRGIGSTTIERLSNFSKLNKCTMYQAMERCDEIATLSSGLKRKVINFVDMIERFQEKKKQVPMDDFAQHVLQETGYYAHLKSEYGPDREDRLENIQELLSALKTHEEEVIDPSLENFLADVTLVADVDQWDDDQDSVTLMTLHSAKGLEFKYVFITGLEEGLLPHFSSLEIPEQLEEERRLFYVGITRAQEKLFLTHALNRNRYGNESLPSTPSQFIKEIPEELIEELTRTTRRNKRRTKFSTVESSARKVDIDQYEQEVEAPEDNDSIVLKVGDQVRHPSWGVGEILTCKGKGDRQKVTVRFHNGMQKRLMVKFANLTKV
ncbi:MAG: DNA helicase PcrA [Candidatus Cloacimonetes bacterium 4572_55]|nr:MAG: DNA helicase PcrA [Candidatus Cloacimonetes bacterium 4572_55]